MRTIGLEVLSDPEAMAAIAEARTGTSELTTGEEMAEILAKRFGRGAAWKYRLRLSAAARRALSEKLPEQVVTAVWEFLTGPLTANPYRAGKRLRYELADLYVARRGQYRVLYRILDNEVLVEVVKISHRSDIHN